MVAWKLLGGMVIMNNSGDMALGGSVTRRVKQSKHKRTRTGRGGNGKGSSQTHQHDTPPMAAAGTLTRTKALLLAALRVWELKHRIKD